MNIITTKYTKYSLQFFINELSNYDAKLFFDKYKLYLTPAFCFKHLYNNTINPIYYNEIISYYSSKYTLEQLTSIYDTSIFNLNSCISKRELIKQFCTKDCKTCIDALYCF